jgi:hypothetical protein
MFGYAVLTIVILGLIGRNAFKNYQVNKERVITLDDEEEE